ncbi:MAG: cyclase family protein [Terriglobia bacterium]
MRSALLTMLVAVLGLAETSLQAQSWEPPADSARCPSKWGPSDQRGAGNHMKPQTVLRALQLVKTGEVIELGHVLSSSMPLNPGRMFNLVTKRTQSNQGSNRRGGNEEIITSEIGQVGTQFDGFAHQTIGDSLYNCRKQDEISTRNGFTSLGIEQVGTLLTRGALIDVAGLKGVEMLPESYEITVQDLEQSLQRKNLRLQPGDAVIIHTGWGRLWGKDNARYLRNNPGLGVAAAEWLARQDPMLIGIDNAPVNVTPSPDPKLSNPVHQIMLVVNGIHLLENLKLDQLAATGAAEFAFIVQPLKLQGASGSTVAPVAVR